jgi:hypothetical protein
MTERLSLKILPVDFRLGVAEPNGTHLRQLQGDRACAVARKLTRKGWPLAANPWRALRKCNVGPGNAHTFIAHPLTLLGY